MAEGGRVSPERGPPQRPRHLALLAIGLCGALLLGACSSTSRTSTAPSPTATSPGSSPPPVSASPTPTATAISPSPSPSPTVKPTVKPTGSPTSTPAPAPATATPAGSPSTQAVLENGTLAVADANNGQTVTLHLGNEVEGLRTQFATRAGTVRARGRRRPPPAPGAFPGRGAGPPPPRSRRCPLARPPSWRPARAVARPCCARAPRATTRSRSSSPPDPGFAVFWWTTGL